MIHLNWLRALNTIDLLAYSTLHAIKYILDPLMVDLRTFLHHIHPVSSESWEAVQPLFIQRHLQKGSFFIREGEYAQDFAFVESGLIRAYYTDANAKEYTKQFFMNPSIIGGYASLISGKPALFSQQAITDCTVLAINYVQLVQFYNYYPDLERLGRKFAEKYFVENEKKEIELVLKNATLRYEHFRATFPGIEQLVAQYQVASYLGITATQLSRIRKNFTSP